ncbi:MAG TPA: hypothetical protein VD862_04600 [Candidatus Paceibacterota bacterium]|nr:hypothetical protein [Candidatus Paceibacterota bacterium]
MHHESAEGGNLQSERINEHCAEHSSASGAQRPAPKPMTTFLFGALAGAAVIGGAWLLPYAPRGDRTTAPESAAFEETVLPRDGIALPISWGDLGARMVADGVIDRQAFEALYESRGGLNPYERTLLEGRADTIRMDANNAGIILNLLWAFGLANTNPVLEEGPMTDPQYGGAGRFASTGGWSIAVGDAMDHYSGHRYVKLTSEQQALVESVARNVYRPCCGNSTYFPDCNHGMAMLGLLELMAANGAGEEEMYRVALQVNAYWFPDTYLTIAKYLDMKGRTWESADPRELLGAQFSSGTGYRNILSEVEPVQGRSGGACGV